MIVRSAIVPAISLYGKPGQHGRKKNRASRVKPGTTTEISPPIKGCAGLSAPYSRPLLGGEECST